MDVSEILWRLTEALVAELSVCVALGWSLYQIYSVQKFHQSRHLARTKLHPEYPYRKKMNPALKQEISVFCESEHPKNIQLLDKIHTVFTAANSMFARLGTDYEIRNRWFFAIWEAMTTDSDLSQSKCNDHLQQAVGLIICASESDSY